MYQRIVTNMKIHRLEKIGFIHIGHWSMKDDKLILNVTIDKDVKNILYAFVINKKVMYVGKTTNTLQKRFSGYIDPGSTQNTNIKVNGRIKSKLSDNKKVQIYAFVDNQLLKYGDFNINLAEGLEKSIIDSLEEPFWNGKSLKGEESIRTLSELDKIDEKLTLQKWNKIRLLQERGLNPQQILLEMKMTQLEYEILMNDYHEITGM
mgnify:CR=1 FL=1